MDGTVASFMADQGFQINLDSTPTVIDLSSTSSNTNTTVAPGIIAAASIGSLLIACCGGFLVFYYHYYVPMKKRKAIRRQREKEETWNGSGLFSLRSQRDDGPDGVAALRREELLSARATRLASRKKYFTTDQQRQSLRQAASARESARTPAVPPPPPPVVEEETFSSKYQAFSMKDMYGPGTGGRGPVGGKNKMKKKGKKNGKEVVEEEDEFQPVFDYATPKGLTRTWSVQATGLHASPNAPKVRCDVIIGFTHFWGYLSNAHHIFGFWFTLCTFFLHSRLTPTNSPSFVTFTSSILHQFRVSPRCLKKILKCLNRGLFTTFMATPLLQTVSYLPLLHEDMSLSTRLTITNPRKTMVILLILFYNYCYCFIITITFIVIISIFA